MDSKRNEQRKEWLKKHPETEKKPSMLRRKSDHDYQQPCIYMITIVVKDHRPLLGSLKAPRWQPSTPLDRTNRPGQCGKE